MNSLIEQWGVLSTTTVQQPTITFYIKFLENPCVKCTLLTTGPEGATRHVFSIYTVNTEKFGVFGNSSLLAGFHWAARGK